MLNVFEINFGESIISFGKNLLMPISFRKKKNRLTELFEIIAIGELTIVRGRTLKE